MNNNLVEQILVALNVENICDDYVKAIEIISDAIIHPKRHTHGNKVAVIPLNPGGGKSVITNISLAWLIKNDLHSAGTILLKERIADCEKTVAQRLNGSDFDWREVA